MVIVDQLSWISLCYSILKAICDVLKREWLALTLKSLNWTTIGDFSFFPPLKWERKFPQESDFRVKKLAVVKMTWVIHWGDSHLVSRPKKIVSFELRLSFRSWEWVFEKEWGVFWYYRTFCMCISNNSFYIHPVLQCKDFGLKFSANVYNSICTVVNLHYTVIQYGIAMDTFIVKTQNLST